MRRIRYAVAASLDGYIAGPKGEADSIIMDPAIDFNSFFQQFDTVLLGRRTFETMARGGNAGMPGMKTFIFSRTLRQSDYPEVTIVAENSEETLAALRQQSGKDIWLFGAVHSFAASLTQGLSIRLRSLSSRYFSAKGFRCLHRPPREGN